MRHFTTDKLFGWTLGMGHLTPHNNFRKSAVALISPHTTRKQLKGTRRQFERGRRSEFGWHGYTWGAVSWQFAPLSGNKAAGDEERSSTTLRESRSSRQPHSEWAQRRVLATRGFLRTRTAQANFPPIASAEEQGDYIKLSMQVEGGAPHEDEQLNSAL